MLTISCEKHPWPTLKSLRWSPLQVLLHDYSRFDAQHPLSHRASTHPRANPTKNDWLRLRRLSKWPSRTRRRCRKQVCLLGHLWSGCAERVAAQISRIVLHRLLIHPSQAGKGTRKVPLTFKDFGRSLASEPRKDSVPTWLVSCQLCARSKKDLSYVRTSLTTHTLSESKLVLCSAHPYLAHLLLDAPPFCRYRTTRASPSDQSMI